MSHTDKDEQLPEGGTDVQDIAEGGLEDNKPLTAVQEEANTHPIEIISCQL